MRPIFISLAFLFLNTIAIAQLPTAYSVGHTVHKIESKHLGETRTILVHVPEGYRESTEKFPVVYMLDGHTPHPEMMAGIIANQSWGAVIPELILVSITNTDRTRDMTPTHLERFRTSGGAEAFLDYIEKEVVPLVESNYRTANYRIFAGHSFGGLLALHAFVHRPSLFQGVIAASPYLQWDDDLLVRQASKQLPDYERETTVFVGVGDEPDYFSAIDEFKSVLKKRGGKRLSFEFEKYPEDNHESAVLSIYRDGLRKIYTGWVPKNLSSAPEIADHYRSLSKRFGYEIVPKEAYLNALGYALLLRNQMENALGVFKANIDYHPQSANVYDSYAECLEKMGRKKQALENYEKAVELAAKQGNETLRAASAASVERLKQNQE